MESQHPASNQAHATGSSELRKRLTVVYPKQNGDASDAEVDIVAVHGLGSDVDWSWTYKDGAKYVRWLEDLDMLPAKVPRARIAIYSYESKWHADAPKIRLQLCGEELVHSLNTFREEYPKRPIVFVGHSLGGNVILHALLYASSEEKYDSLLKATAGFVSLGTPFRGTKWQPFLDALVRLMGPAGPHNGISKELGYDEPVLRDRLHEFCKLCNKLSMPISCFTELLQTDYARRWGISGVVKGMVVEEASAHIPGRERYALSKDHLKMNKFHSSSDPAFERVSYAISQMCCAAKDIVRYRFEPREIITDNRAALKYSPQAGNCLQDLYVTDPLDDKKALKRKKGKTAAGTCQWFLGTEELTAWLSPGDNSLSESQTSRVLWLHGNPGTGKSTLAMFLTDELSTDFSAASGRTLAYFFCDSTFDTRRTATSVVRGLLLQLVQQHPELLSYVLPKYQERKKKLFDSFDALWALFMSASAAANAGHTYCIIDALDECEPESQEILLHQIGETFDKGDAPPNLHVLITSRPHTNIREKLDVFANKDLASFPEVKKDIKAFITQKVAELAQRKNYSTKVKAEVSDILEAKAEGTFLWIGIVCKELEKEPSRNAVSRLTSIPKGLHSLYEKLLDTALEHEEDQDSIRIILKRVAVSQRPLKLLELSEACSLCLDQEDLETREQFMREYVESCHMVIVIQDEKVLLLHQSVKDYLLKAGTTTSFDELEAHADFAYRCLDCVMERVVEQEKRPTNFSEYAIIEWPNHAHMAGRKFVSTQHAEFLSINSSYPEIWRRLYNRTQRPSGHLPYGFSMLHVAAQWSIPEIMEYLCDSSTHRHNLEDLFNQTDESGLTLLAYAAQAGPADLVPFLLERGAKVTDMVLLKAMSNQSISKASMVLLLGRREEGFSITNSMTYHMARREKKGKTGIGTELMAILGDPRVGKLRFTEEAICHMVQYWSKELIEWFLEQRRGEFIIMTEQLVEFAASNESATEVISLVLEHGEEDITVTENMLLAAARNIKGKEVLQFFLNRRGEDAKISEAVVKAAVGNEGGTGAITFLLDGQFDFKITQAVLKAAARNRELGDEVIRLLLDRRGEEITITEKVVKAAAGNEKFGEEVIRLLLDRRGEEITITEEVVKAAAGNWGLGEEVIRLLLDIRGEEITITEEVVKCAAENGAKGKEVMSVLLDRRGEEVHITEEVVKIAARFHGGKLMEYLFDRRGEEIKITEGVVKVAAGMAEVMDVLLYRRAEEIKITEEVVKAAATSKSYGAMKVLLNKRREETKITEEVVKTAASNSDVHVMELLLDQQGDAIITEEVLKAAARNSEPRAEVMGLLLDRRGDIPITDEMLEATYGNKMGGEAVMRALLARGSDIAVTEKVLKAAAGNLRYDWQVIRVLLARRDDTTIGEEVLSAAAGNLIKGGEITRVLLDQRDDISIGEKVLKAAAGNLMRGGEVMRVLLDQRDDITIGEEVLKAAAGNEWSGTEVMRVLLDQRNDVTIGEEVLEAAAGNEGNNRARLAGKAEGVEVMRVILDRKGNITVTKKVLEAAAGNDQRGESVIRFLLEQRHGVKFTEEALDFAEVNEPWGEEILSSLQGRRGEMARLQEEAAQDEEENRGVKRKRHENDEAT